MLVGYLVSPFLTIKKRKKEKIRKVAERDIRIYLIRFLFFLGFKILRTKK